VQSSEQDFLNLVEQTKKLVFIDIEAAGLRSDYSSVLVVSVKPYGRKAYSILLPPMRPNRARAGVCVTGTRFPCLTVSSQVPLPPRRVRSSIPHHDRAGS